jgi:hypothetical protein
MCIPSLAAGELVPIPTNPAKVDVAVVEVAKIAATVGVEVEVRFPKLSKEASMLVGSEERRKFEKVLVPVNVFESAKSVLEANVQVLVEYE